MNKVRLKLAKLLLSVIVNSSFFTFWKLMCASDRP